MPLDVPVTNAVNDIGDPAVIALLNAQGQLVCTGAIIAPHTVLTAAHCLGPRPLTLQAFFGNVLGDGSMLIAVTDARPHPQFDPATNDIAVLTLADPAPPPPLAFAPPVDGSLVGASVKVVGFGTVGSLGGDGTKRIGFAKVAALGSDDFLATPDPSLSCLGDSGGPALLAGDAIGGVVSRVDIQCVDHAVYTRVDIAQDVLIQPYLAETAEGAATEGQPCFYDGHCAAGLACVGDTARTCERDTGCGCHTAGAHDVWLAVLAAAWCLRVRRVRARGASGRSRSRT